jgi:hypothetical protein
MKRAAVISVVVSCIVGVSCAEIVVRSIVGRDKIGTLCGRGHLIALVNDRGIYQSDVDRMVNENHYLVATVDGAATDTERQLALTGLIVNFALLSHADREGIRRTDVSREINLLRSQFRGDKTWGEALHKSGFITPLLWQTLKNDLRARRWIAKRIAPELEVTEAECRGFYDSHLANFFVPERIHASHLFLAAPPETSPEIVGSKQIAIEALSVRLIAGEDFSKLVAENSEDEATKLRGGDLGYFSRDRMPPDFVEAALKLHPGENSKPIRTRLGFHLLKLIDVQPARQKTFDEARSDIAIDLANLKRASAVQKLIVDLSPGAGYLRPL